MVRRVRGGLELRVDGTLASLHRPGRALTGAVWWTLAAPALLLPRPRRRRLHVLLLGLGGGSVARALRALAPEAHIVGVERDAEVLRLARRHFGLDRLRVELVEGDALLYLRRERRGFDLVVEDLFEGTPRAVRKPAWLLDEGYRLIRRRLRPGGLAVSNTIHEMKAMVRAMRPFGERVVSLDVRGHWNRIVVCGSKLPDAREIRRRLQDSAVAKLMNRLSVRSRAGAPGVPLRARPKGLPKREGVG